MGKSYWFHKHGKYEVYSEYDAGSDFSYVDSDGYSGAIADETLAMIPNFGPGFKITFELNLHSISGGFWTWILSIRFIPKLLAIRQRMILNIYNLEIKRWYFAPISAGKHFPNFVAEYTPMFTNF